jgi:hypothetical protein
VSQRCRNTYYTIGVAALSSRRRAFANGFREIAKAVASAFHTEVFLRREVYVDAGCLLRANSRHSPTAWRTGQFDPLLPFKIGPVNEREARESGLSLELHHTAQHCN